MYRHRDLVPFAVLIAAASGPLPAQEVAPAADILVVRFAGLEAAAVDTRDASLRGALGGVDDLLAEWLAGRPPRTPEGDEELAAELAGRLLSGPLVLRLGEPQRWSPGGAERHLQLELEVADWAEARALERDFDRIRPSLLAGGPRAGRALTLGRRFADSLGPLNHAALHRDGAPVLAIALGQPKTLAALLGGDDLPEGVDPFLQIALELPAGSGPLVEALLGERPDPALVLLLASLLGPRTEGVRAAWGFGPERLHGSVRRLGGAPRLPALDERDFARVPADVRELFALQADLDDWFEDPPLPAELAAAVEEGLATFEMLTGIDPWGDLLEHLGPTLGYYTSDTTGGGGLMSMVAFAETTDPGALARTLARLPQQIERLAGDTVATRTWTVGTTACTSLTAPGLSVPVEPSWALHGDVLFAAATPQALRAALLQASGRGLPDVRSNPGFLEATDGAPLDDLLSLEFQDTPRALREGYGWALAASTALANALRPGHEPGEILPGYGELTAGARARVAFGRRDGDDLVTTSVADRSLLVNGTALLGSSTAKVISGVFLLAKLALPQAPVLIRPGPRSTALDQMGRIKMALDQYAIDSAARYPDSLEALVTPNEDGYTYLPTRTVPLDPWRNPYQYAPPPPGELEVVLFSFGADGAPGGSGAASDIHFDDR